MIRNTLSKINRFFTNSEFERRFYMWAFLITTIFFVFYGIVPVVSSISKKYAAVNDISVVNKNLGERITSIREQENRLGEIQSSLVYLNRYLPETFGIQDYLVDFALSCAESGYVMQSFHPSDPTEEESFIGASVSLNGKGDLTKLIGNIEAMKRVTQVNLVSVYFSSEDILNMNIKIYTIN